MSLYTYRATVRRIVDGDTWDLDIDLGLYIHVHERVRLFGIDTWEVRGEERERGLLAKAACEELVAESPEIIISTEKDKKGKYGRFLATIWMEDVPQVWESSVNYWLVEEGHGEFKSY